MLQMMITTLFSAGAIGLSRNMSPVKCLVGKRLIWA